MAHVRRSALTVTDEVGAVGLAETQQLCEELVALETRCDTRQWHDLAQVFAAVYETPPENVAGIVTVDGLTFWLRGLRNHLAHTMSRVDEIVGDRVSTTRFEIDRIEDLLDALDKALRSRTGGG